MITLVDKVYAAGTQAAADVSIKDPLGGKVGNLGEIFALVLNIVMGIGWALVFIMLALGFVQYIMSRGEKTAVENAQKWLTYAVIGGVGLFFIYVLKTIIPSLMSANSVTPGGNVVSF
jgi:hypothetical protein